MTPDVSAPTTALVPRATALAERLLRHGAEQRCAELARFFVQAPAGTFAHPIHLIVLFSALAHALTQRVADLPTGRRATNANGGDDAWIDRIERTICERYADRLTLASLARTVGRDRRQVAARFRDHAGISIHQFLTQVRMARAILEILGGDKIESVGLSVGYRSKKNFYRQFRAVTGLTPTEFRRPASGNANHQLLALADDDTLAGITAQRDAVTLACNTVRRPGHRQDARAPTTSGDPR